jgi:hypothetical protein
VFASKTGYSLEENGGRKVTNCPSTVKLGNYMTDDCGIKELDLDVDYYVAESWSIINKVYGKKR